MKPIIAFITGPYRADTDWRQILNIRAAEEMAVALWVYGIPTICPHKNTAHLSGICPERDFLGGYQEILKRCDLLAMTPGWSNSEGTLEELAVAMGNEIPIYDDVIEILRDTEGGRPLGTPVQLRSTIIQALKNAGLWPAAKAG